MPFSLYVKLQSADILYMSRLNWITAGGDPFLMINSIAVRLFKTLRHWTAYDWSLRYMKLQMRSTFDLTIKNDWG